MLVLLFLVAFEVAEGRGLDVDVGHGDVDVGLADVKVSCEAWLFDLVAAAWLGLLLDNVFLDDWLTILIDNDLLDDGSYVFLSD